MASSEQACSAEQPPAGQATERRRARRLSCGLGHEPAGRSVRRPTGGGSARQLSGGTGQTAQRRDGAEGSSGGRVRRLSTGQADGSDGSAADRSDGSAADGSDGSAADGSDGSAAAGQTAQRRDGSDGSAADGSGGSAADGSDGSAADRAADRADGSAADGSDGSAADRADGCDEWPSISLLIPSSTAASFTSSICETIGGWGLDALNKASSLAMYRSFAVCICKSPFPLKI
ncbi:hypothetical protein DPEC_G00282510 [Dallia pectoralis]|uniref:Uncharacterized protein n=1 Tax=Dallia pectoralis TaxID=75939 RepID=A0ACC2FNB1_DALPE|nr:hypothetical protein DPEC_G00282510 [Dallia pectoralis]